MGLLVTLHRKLLHGSGGEPQACLGALEPLLGLVAVGDVLAPRDVEAVPVEVVGVFDQELADRAEVTLDPVQVAGVGGGGDELDVVCGRPLPDRRRPVAGEVVLNQ